jgi:hypothetical protein
VHTAVEGQAVKTGARGLSHLRGAWKAAASLRPRGGSLQQPGAHGVAAAAGGRTVGKIFSQVLKKEAFERWYQNKCLAAVEDPMDVLYGTTRSNVYYWFAQVGPSQN